MQLPSAPQKAIDVQCIKQLIAIPTARVILADITDEFVLNKAVIAYEQEELDAKIKEIPSAYYESYEIIKTRKCFIEFMPKGVTKGIWYFFLLAKRFRT